MDGFCAVPSLLLRFHEFLDLDTAIVLTGHGSASSIVWMHSGSYVVLSLLLVRSSVIAFLLWSLLHCAAAICVMDVCCLDKL